MTKICATVLSTEHKRGHRFFLNSGRWQFVFIAAGGGAEQRDKAELKEVFMMRPLKNIAQTTSVCHPINPLTDTFRRGLKTG